MSPIHIATISSEMVPLAKTGGLGDVCGALPIAMDELGCKASCFLPAYGSVLQSGFEIESTPHTFTIPMSDGHVACRVLKTQFPDTNVDIYLIDQPQYYDRDGLYSNRSGEFRDNCERFSFFARAVCEAISRLGLEIDIAHCHDWQSGLIPAYVKTRFGGHAWMERARTIMTIHNLAYQGRFWHLDMPLTGLDWHYFNWQQMEFHGDLNFLKTGIVFADLVTTVSPTYAREITEPELGCGLESILAAKGEDLIGIVNGVDYEHWDPATDCHLPQQFDISSWRSGKATCKQSLQREMGLDVRHDVPLVGIVSRLADQKGWDLIIPLLQQWCEQRDVHFAILGTGDPDYEDRLADLASRFGHKLAVKLEFSEAVAHRIEAACDIFLMPSRYEPCGLNQLYSLKYGSVPLVHSTGGLADTVVDATESNLATETATGFRFDDYSLAALESTMNRAVDMYQYNQPQWGKIVEAGMRDDWSWKQSAKRYMEIYSRFAPV